MPKQKTIGRGIVQYAKTSWSFDELDSPEAVKVLHEMSESWRWEHGSQLIFDGVVAEYMDKAGRCPGRDDPRCCGWSRLAEATPGELQIKAQQHADALNKLDPDRAATATDGLRTLAHLIDKGCRGGLWR